MPRPYCDIDTDIKPWLGIDVSNTDFDTTLTIMRDSAEQSVIDYVENDFDLHVTTGEILDSHGSDTIVPRNEPLISVENVYLYTSSDGSGGSIIDPENYTVVTAEGGSAIVFRGFYQPRGRSMVRLDYTYGYDGVPATVKEAILLAVEAKYRRKSRKSIGISSRSKKDESESFGGEGAWDSKVGLPSEVVAMLNPLRKFEFPTQAMATRNP